MAIVAGLTIQDPRERPVERRGTGRRVPRPFRRPDQRLPHAAQPLELPRGAAARALRRARSAASARPSSSTSCGCANGRTSTASSAQLAKPLRPHDRRPERQSRRHPQVPARRSSVAYRHRGCDQRLRPSAGANGLGTHRSRADYVGARQAKFVIFPGSTLAKRQPNAVMSAELVETSRLFARMNAAIDPAWAEPIAGDLAKRSYSEPHWEKNQGAVVAYERVTLFGVPIIPRRRVQSRGSTRSSRASCSSAMRSSKANGISKQAFDRANRALRRRAARTRGAHPATRHPRRRRGGVRVLRPAHPGRRRLDPQLRGLVAHGPRRDARPARR